jgi:type II secretory pathway component PulM
MQRIKQLWQGRAPRERLLLGIAGAALLLIIFVYGIVKPYRAYTEELENEIVQQASFVAKMERQRDRGPQIEQHVVQLRQRVQDVRQHLIPGGTPALAASQLQDRLQNLARGSGLDVLTTVSLRDEPAGEFRKTTVQMTLRGGLPELGRFVSAVEYGDWRLTVSSLEVRGAYNTRIAGMQQAGMPKPNPLTVTLEVGGIMQGGHPS